MNAELHSSQQTALSLWEDPEKIKEIRKIFAPILNELEFQAFVGLGKSTRLNPFLREIWAVKYGKDKNGKEIPAQIFIGRDGYRKVAQAQPEYDFHQADAVYENDTFEIDNGTIHHKYTLINRGKLIGAYCITKRHTATKPHFVFVELQEYSTGKSLWADIQWKTNYEGEQYKTGGKPATMIKKVAESQCLRMCFQDILGGTYGEEEMAQEMARIIDAESTEVTIHGNSHTDKLKAILRKENANSTHSNGGDSSEPDNIEHSNDFSASLDKISSGTRARDTIGDNTNSSGCDLPISAEQINIITILFEEKNFSEERKQKALERYKANSLDDFTYEQAELFIKKLETAN